MKACIVRLVLAVLSVVLTLSLTELVLRLADPPVRAKDSHGLHELRPDKPWLYGMRPGAVATYEVTSDIPYRINSQGFRGEEYELRNLSVIKLCPAKNLAPFAPMEGSHHAASFHT